VTSDQPEVTDPAPDLVVHLVLRDLQGNDAFGYTDNAGESVIVADRAVLRNDPAARSAAFNALCAQASARRLPGARFA